MKRRHPSEQMVRSRINLLLLYLILAYVILLGRLFYLQVIRAPFFKEKAQELTVRRFPLPARRGTIYDRNMNKLAFSVDACDISANPLQIKDKAATAKALSPILGIDEATILRKISVKKGFVYLLRRANAGVGDKLKRAKIDGIGIEHTTKRVYPGNELACHVLGFVNVDGKGVQGLEKAYDKELRGKDGYVIEEVDAKGRFIPGTKRAQVDPVNGEDIVLTIDSVLQHSLEVNLRKSYEEHKAAAGTAVMMDPQTGEILALANMPDFDPNHPGDAKPAAWRNRAVSDLYEPGSTLKTITACAAVETKAVGLNEIFYCHGTTRIGNRTLRCELEGRRFAHGHGAVNLAKMLKYSCNITAAAVGARVGGERLYNFEKAFGLYERPGTGMPGEICGWHDNWKDWAAIRLANIAFGQGIAVTPMQVVRAYGAVANGGLLMRPYIVSKILRGGVVKQEFGPEVTRRVISEETSAVVSDMLGGVVTGGTGQAAQVDGYKVAGKTGSAQVAINGRYVPGKIVASFAGFLPITKPRVVMLVTVSEPEGCHFGAVVAAPVFQAAAKDAMWRLKVPPDNAPEDEAPMVDNDAVKPIRRIMGEQNTSPKRLRLGG